MRTPNIFGILCISRFGGWRLEFCCATEFSRLDAHVRSAALHVTCSFQVASAEVFGHARIFVHILFVESRLIAYSFYMLEKMPTIDF